MLARQFVGRVYAIEDYKHENPRDINASEQIHQLLSWYEPSFNEKRFEDPNKEFWDKYLMLSNPVSAEVDAVAPNSQFFFDQAVENRSLALLLSEMNFGFSANKENIIWNLISLTDQQMSHI